MPVRRVGMNLKRLLIAATILFVVFALYNHIQISKFYINRLRLYSNKLTKPLKITQITDFHSNTSINLDKLFIDIKEFNPDIIAITGDLIDHKTTDFNAAIRILKESKKITQKVFFVNGNHEIGNLKYREFLKVLNDNEIIILDDNSYSLELNDNRIKLFGASFYAEERDYKRLFDEINGEDYNILLSHSPNRPIKYLNENTDLILSGHTHGGQIRLPFVGGILIPGQKLMPKYDKGVFEIGDTTLYIDSGLGNSVYPIRTLNRVQITNITIQAKK